MGISTIDRHLSNARKFIAPTGPVGVRKVLAAMRADGNCRKNCEEARLFTDDEGAMLMGIDTAQVLPRPPWVPACTVT